MKIAWFALAVVALVAGLAIGIRATDSSHSGPSTVIVCNPPTSSAGGTSPFPSC